MTRWNPPAARRRVVRELREVSSWVHSMISTWTPTGTVWPSLTSARRPRRVDEYPENDRAAWLALANRCHKLADDLTQLESYALGRLYAIDRREVSDRDGNPK